MRNAWSDDELDAIVADYFAMLAAEQNRQRYAKSAHRAALMQHIKRSSGSIEYKYQNISAVLEVLGLPWISGYKPMKNYQKAIVGAIIYTPFFLTRRELEASKELDAWRLYRVHQFTQTPRIFTLAPPLDALLHLYAETWRASF